MNTSVKSSHPLRYAVLGAAVMLSICFWVLRSRLSPVSLPALPQLARHDTARAAAPARMETIPGSVAVVPAKSEAAAAPVSPAAFAPEPPATQPAGNLSQEDRAFFEKAGQAGIQQDKLSHGVLNQLVYPEVREYAYALMDEQTAINAELLLLAARKQVVVPMPERIAFRRWSREEGSIDQHYVNTLLEADAEAVALYEKAAQSDDADIAGFARRTLPIVQRQLTAVKALKKITE